jgi:hypothetical protein
MTKPAKTIGPKREHESATRTLGYALTLGEGSAWLGAAKGWAVRLSRQERAGLALSALKSLGSERAELVAELMLRGRNSTPLPPLFGIMDEASFWADMADPKELKAYCLACFNRMPGTDQGAFLDYVQRRAAA